MNSEDRGGEKTPLITINGKYVINQDKHKNTSQISKEVPVKSAGMFSSTINLLNTCIGGGILAYPYGYLSTGLLTGACVTIILGFLASSTLLVICYAADASKDPNIKSYQDVMKHYLGEIGKKISEIVLTLYLAGACVCFLTIVGDSLQPLFMYFLPSYPFIYDRKFLIVVFGIVFVYPLCLLRKVKLLSYPSGLANLGVAYLGIVILITCLIHLIGDKPIYPPEILLFNTRMYKGLMPQLFMSIPIIAFSFQCHVIIMPLYHELKNATLTRMTIIVVISITVTVSCYVAIGAFGLLMFGDKTNPDILLSYPQDSIIAIIGRIAISITSTFSFPMVYFTDRLSIQTLLFSVKSTRKYIFNKDTTLQTWSFVTISTVLFAIILLIAVVVPDIVTAFGFVGSIGAVTLDFFLPSILLGVLIVKSRWKFKWFFLSYPVILIAVSLTMMIGGIGVTIFKIQLGNVD